MSPALRSVFPPTLSFASAALADAVAEVFLSSANAPTASAPTTCVARAQSPYGGTSDAPNPSRRSWPDTLVSTASDPVRFSSPSSDSAPSGSFA